MLPTIQLLDNRGGKGQGGVDKSENRKWPKSLDFFLLIKCHKDDSTTMFEQQRRRKKKTYLTKKNIFQVKSNKVNIKGEGGYLVLQIGQFT